MPRHFNCSLLRTALIVFGAIFIGHDANADAYSPANDPFVIRTINHGDEMTSGFSDRSWNYRVSDPRWSNLPRSVQIVPFPPAPPALGEELSLANGAGLSRPSLGDFAREVFYGPYSISLGLTKLSTKELARFAAYRRTRQTLIDEIQLKFDELSAASPVGRAAGLTKLAAKQEEPLCALAAEAESIRNDLVRTAPFTSFDFPATNVTSRDGVGGWTSSSLHFGSASQSPTFAREFVNLFSAAYYDDGLSTEQRLLLAEIAYAQPAASTNTAPEVAAGKNAYIYFLPATARIRLPVNLPSSLEEKIHAFTSEKESLKSELRNAVLRENYFFTWRRSHQLAALAEQQAPRFRALEAIAEEIRVGLADFDYPDQPAQPELPPDLTQRVGNFYARKVEVQRELLNRLRSLRSEFPSARFDIARQGDGLAIVQTVPDAKGAASLTEFNASLSRRYSAFATESEILRRDIQRYTESTPNRTARTVDQLAADFKRAYAARDNWNRYRDYYRAVLAPGLSPAQRQLLFQAAVVGLDQADQQPQS